MFSSFVGPNCLRPALGSFDQTSSLGCQKMNRRDAYQLAHGDLTGVNCGLQYSQMRLRDLKEREEHSEYNNFAKTMELPASWN